MENILNFFKNISLRNWIIIGIITLIIIALIIYFLNKDNVTEGSDVNKTLGENLSASSPRSVFPLQYGSRVEQVKVVQKYLNSKGEKLVEDGIWGPLTGASVLKVLKVTTLSEDLYKTLA